jgi:hypothetical protein
MRQLGIAAMVVALLGGATGPIYAQMQTPNINLLQDTPSKTPEEKEADEARDKAYKNSLKKIPEAKAPNDPWGGVRSSDVPKTSTGKAPASAKKTKTGSNAN